MGITRCISLCLVLLSACAAHHTVSPQACLQQCAKLYKICEPQCKNNCPACKEQNRKEAAEAYRQYRKELKVQNGWITRQLQSYRDPLKCRQPTCDCAADKTICQTACLQTI